MANAAEVFNLETRVLTGACNPLDVGWPYGRLAMPARNVEHIGRLAQPGYTATQGANKRLAIRDCRAQMAGTGREIAMVQVVGLDAVLDQRSHQRRERVRIVVDAAQEHALAEHRQARIDDARAG